VLRAFWTVLATGCTLAVIGLSMAMNFAFGYGLGTTPANARILGALSVACDGLKALLPLFIAWQWAGRRRLAALAGSFLFLLLLAWGAASAIGFAAENRAAFTGQRDAGYARLQAALGDLKAAETRLAALPGHRPLALVAAEIAALKKDRLWDLTGACADATRTASRGFCQRLELLQGELALGREAGALDARIEALKRDILRARALGATPDTDPQARAIAALTGLDADQVRSGLTWLVALAIEAISAFGLFAISRRRTAPAAQQRPAPGRTLRLADGAPPPSLASAPAKFQRLLHGPRLPDTP
jgi:hypothetical protein